MTQSVYHHGPAAFPWPCGTVPIKRCWK